MICYNITFIVTQGNVLTIPTKQVRENFPAKIKDSGIDEETTSLDEALNREASEEAIAAVQ